MNWCILIPLLVGLLCALLGYLLGRLFGGNNKEEIEIYESKIRKLEAELKACNESKVDVSFWEKKVSGLEEDLHNCKKDKLKIDADLAGYKTGSTIQSLGAANIVEETLLPFDADVAKAVFGKKIKQDDLKIVEGIGPKIEGLFHDFDIKTWKALSEATVEKCQEVLNSGGERYKIHNPGTWPKQAELAYEGKWTELLKWQDELDGGKA